MWKKWRPVSERSTFWNCDLPRKTAWFIGILQKLGRYNPKKTQPTSGLFSWSLKWCQVMTSSETKHRLKLTDARQNGSMQNSSAIHMIVFLKKTTETTLPETNIKWIPWENRPNPLKKKEISSSKHQVSGANSYFQGRYKLFRRKTSRNQETYLDDHPT